MYVPCIFLFSPLSIAFLCLTQIPLLCKSSGFDLIPLFLQSLEFDLIVYAPYRCIDGFVDDMEVSTINPNPFFLLISCFLICTRKLI
jgi:hypothetical protein